MMKGSCDGYPLFSGAENKVFFGGDLNLLCVWCVVVV